MQSFIFEEDIFNKQIYGGSKSKQVNLGEAKKQNKNKQHKHAFP